MFQNHHMYQSETSQLRPFLTLVFIYSRRSIYLETILSIETCAFLRDWQMRNANYTVDCNDRIAAGYPHYVLAT